MSNIFHLRMNYLEENNTKLTGLINKLWEQKFTAKIEPTNFKPCDLLDVKGNESTLFNSNFQDNSGMNNGEIKKTYECTVCGKQLLKKSNLERHFRSHTGEKPYECFTCHKRFTRKDILVNHLRTHTGEKLFECIICGKRFSDKRNLNSHLNKCG